MESKEDEVLKMNLEDLAKRIVALENFISVQQGEIRGLKGRVESLERR